MSASDARESSRSRGSGTGTLSLRVGGILVGAMLLVIIGAGASFDSYPEKRVTAKRALPGVQETEYLRPPLAQDLFDTRPAFMELYEKYDMIGGLVHQLRRSRENLETDLEAIQDSVATDPTMQRDLLALRFYLQEAIYSVQNKWRAVTAGVTNYAFLALELRRWSGISGEPVRFVSFNYDYMLESACQSHIPGLDTSLDMDWYVRRDDFRIFKPHGSVLWSQPIEQLVKTGGINWFRGVLALGTEIKPLEEGFYIHLPPGTPHTVNGTNRTSVPAIALPLAEKATFVLPSEHQEIMADDLSDVDKVLVVGWKAGEGHFLDLWHDQKKALARRALVVSSDDAHDVGKILTNRDLVSDVTEFSAGFSTFSSNPTPLREFLKA